ncbi:hypothetical protein TKK_0007764 [Trichogramma kaykai]
MAIFGLVSAVTGFVKVRYLIDKAVIDNMIFRAHYRITSAILFACCIIVTANNLIGDPINCITDNGVPGHVINTYCWITYTFTMPTDQFKQVGVQVPHPAIGNENNGEKKYHSYYQWVPFMLFFQGVMFYAPHWIWKQWENGTMRSISDGMRGAIMDSRAERQARLQRLVQYLTDTMHMHNMYAFIYFLTEVLNFVNVIVNMFMVDKFLGGTFLQYGWDVVKFSQMDQEFRRDPMIEVFPRVTKCTFHKYGASGTIQTHDALCVLALNILNEKIYVFLWFWFIILACMSGVAIVYSAAIVLLPSTREYILRRRFKFVDQNAVTALVRKTQIGDFLMIHLLGQNMNMMMFNEVLEVLCRRLHMGSSGASPSSNLPSAPSTLEMNPIYPAIDKAFGKDEFSKDADM